MKKIKYLFLVIVLIVLDQLSKFLVSTNMELYQEIPIIKNFFSLLYIRNDGAAFSIFKGQMFFFFIVTFIALLVIAYLFKTSKSKFALITTSILLAGVLGNFIDRLLYGEVVDFLSFTFNTYKFAIFNIADCYISIAVVLFVIETLFFEKGNKNGKNNS
ncbi:signal peptidase II [Bacilli bacterium PM5-3]|nr:signal peptidase II [Bacilli bacterium PM5-3]MDH6604346.1 signal peptidase II [Bacilli bacterium PM5-9]